MRVKTIVLVMAAAIFMLVSFATAAENLVEIVATGCEKEITTYCSDVTPGEGRILACLYARSDKLSGKCEFALYDAAVQLERFVAAISYLADECDDDLDKFCSGVSAGEGRLLKCLDDNAAKISDRCTQALKDVGAKK
jgi:hypothetical protein